MDGLSWGHLSQEPVHVLKSQLFNICHHTRQRGYQARGTSANRPPLRIQHARLLYGCINWEVLVHKPDPQELAMQLSLGLPAVHCLKTHSASVSHSENMPLGLSRVPLPTPFQGMSRNGADGRNLAAYALLTDKGPKPQIQSWHRGFICAL